MKLHHHVPVGLIGRPDPVMPGYQAEVDRATSKAMVMYEQAQRRLAQAEARASRAHDRLSTAHGAKAIRDADRGWRVAAELVELRREELLALERLMHSSPAAVAHRGRGAYRPVPQPGSPI